MTIAGRSIGKFFGALAGVAAFASLAASGSAQAATLSLSGGSDMVLPTSFNPPDAIAGLTPGTTHVTVFTGTSNTGGLFVSPSVVNLQFDFLGKEAGFNNALYLTDGTFLFDNTATANVTTTGPLPIDAGPSGAVPFMFQTPDGLDAKNGGSIADGLSLAFYEVSSTVFYAMFDDNGAGPDKDFDDMVIRITVTDSVDNAPPIAPTPLPGAVWLFGTVLAGGAGIGRWRRRRKTSN